MSSSPPYDGQSLVDAARVSARTVGGELTMGREYGTAATIAIVPAASLLPLLDAAYDLDASRDAWLEALAETAVRSFPHGDGVTAYTFEFAAPPRVTAAYGVEEIARIPTMIFEELPLEAVRAAYGSDPRALPVSWSWAGPAGPQLPAPFVRAYGALGLADGYAVLVPDGTRGLAIGIGMPRNRYRNTLPATIEVINQRWTAFARHARHALRLREAVDAGHIAGELDEIGRGELLPALERSRGSIADAVRHAEAARADVGRNPVGAMTVWTQLLEGRWSIVRSRRHGGRVRYLVVENPRADVLRRLSPLERRVAERVVIGDALKAIAIDLELQESSIANALQRAMRKLGVESRTHLVRLGAALRGRSTLGTEHAREDRQVRAPVDAQLP